MSTSSFRLKNALGWVFVALAPLAYYSYVSLLALDVPVGDDFVVIINYLMRSDATSSWATKWHELTFQFIEHRLVFTRLLAQVIRGLLGHLDFSWMILVGNFSLLGVVGVLYRVLRANGFSVWYLLPVVLIVFQPIAYESHFWSISATNYMPVCLFALLAFYALSEKKFVGAAAAWLLAIAATYTFANGLIVWPVGALVLLLAHQRRLFMAWVASAAFIVWMYYHGHSYHPQPSMIDNLRERFPMVVANFFLLVGACFNPLDTLHPFGGADLPALVAGIAIVLVLLATSFRLASAKLLPVPKLFMNRLTLVEYGTLLWAAALFLLLSCAAFAAGRSTTNAVVTDSRYRDFSVFTTVLAYCNLLLALAPGQRRPWLGFATVASMIFCVTSYILYTPRLLSQNANLKAGLYNWHHNRHWLIYQGASYFDAVVDRISTDLDQVNWYRLPNYITATPVLSATKIASADAIDNINQIAYWNLPIDPIGSSQPYFWIHTSTQTYLFVLKRPTSLTNLLHTGRSIGNYFVTELPYGRVLPKGSCNISVFIEATNQRLSFFPEMILTKRAL